MQILKITKIIYKQLNKFYKLDNLINFFNYISFGLSLSIYICIKFYSV